MGNVANKLENEEKTCKFESGIESSVESGFVFLSRLGKKQTCQKLRKGNNKINKNKSNDKQKRQLGPKMLILKETIWNLLKIEKIENM